MIRALFITKHLRVGGAQRGWALLLPDLEELGVQPRVVTLEDRGEFFEQIAAAGVPASCAGMRGRLDLPSLLRAFHVKRWRPEVIVSHDERSHVAARSLARGLAVPLVASDHGGPGGRLKPHRELILRASARGFAATVTMSERRVADLVRRGFPRERVHVIANGVDGKTMRPARPRAALRAELGLGEHDFVALLPAVLRPEKRADRFVQAVSLAAKADVSIRGLVAGYGPEEGDIRRLARTHGGAVKILGHRHDIVELIAASDAICLTSEVEGAPFAALEAMALGKPVLAMRAGSIDEVVEEGKTGVLVRPGDVDGLADELVSLSRDRPRAQALGAAGQLRQRCHFDAARMRAAHARLFGELVAARRNRTANVPAATSVR